MFTRKNKSIQEDGALTWKGFMEPTVLPSVFEWQETGKRSVNFRRTIAFSVVGGDVGPRLPHIQVGYDVSRETRQENGN